MRQAPPRTYTEGGDSIPGYIPPWSGGGAIIPRVKPFWVADPRDVEIQPVETTPVLVPVTAGGSGGGGTTTPGTTQDSPASPKETDAPAFDQTTMIVGAAVILGAVILLTGGKK